MSKNQWTINGSVATISSLSIQELLVILKMRLQETDCKVEKEKNKFLDLIRKDVEYYVRQPCDARKGELLSHTYGPLAEDLDECVKQLRELSREVLNLENQVLLRLAEGEKP